MARPLRVGNKFVKKPKSIKRGDASDMLGSMKRKLRAKKHILKARVPFHLAFRSSLFFPGLCLAA